MSEIGGSPMMIAIVSALAGVLMTYFVPKLFGSGDKAKAKVESHRKEWETSINEMLNDIKNSVTHIEKSTVASDEQRKTIFLKIEDNKNDIEKNTARIEALKDGLFQKIIEHLPGAIQKP